MITFPGKAKMSIEIPSHYQSTRSARIACLLLAMTLVMAGPVQADYGFDPGFNPNYFIDALATGDSGGAYRIGRKVVVLPNGDFVVAGAMRFPNDPIDSAYANIGLARYNAAGVRVTWSGTANPHAWFNRQY